MPDGRTERLIGTCRSFGALGPVYKVLGIAEERGGDTMLRILLVESGEETQYRLSHAIEDPLAA